MLKCTGNSFDSERSSAYDKALFSLITTQSAEVQKTDSEKSWKFLIRDNFGIWKTMWQAMRYGYNIIMYRLSLTTKFGYLKMTLHLYCRKIMTSKKKDNFTDWVELYRKHSKLNDVLNSACLKSSNLLRTYDQN